MFRLPTLTPYVRAMLIALGVVFTLSAILENFLGVPVVRFLALETRALSVLTPLQLLTHVWIVPPNPNAVFWLALSGFFLWLIMAPFEERYGARRVLELTLVAALSSGVPALLVGLVLPRFAAPLAGPQAITLCAICAYAVLLPPYAEVSFFGLMLKPKHLVMIMLAFSLLGFITSVNAAVLAGDLGAIGGGMAFVKHWMQRPPRRRKGPKKGSSRLHVVRDRESEPKRWLN